MDIETLAKDWLSAKAEEAAANKRRVALEGQIIDILGVIENSSKTHDVGDFKVTITGKLNYKANFTALDEALKSIAMELHPIKVERKLDEKGLKYLQNNEPEIFNLIAPALTITPAKTSVTVKQKD